MRILVTGAGGFIGIHLVDLLIKHGHEVYSVDDLSGGYQENLNKNSLFAKIDLRNRKKTEEYIHQIKPQIIYHLAADATEGRSQFTPINSTSRNYQAYLNVLIPAIQVGLKKIVLTSSMSVYGSQRAPFTEDLPRKPDDIYGLAKASMEHATEILSSVHGFKYTIIRPHNVYGPRQNMADPYRNVIAIFINRLLQNKNFYIFGDGQQKRAFTYIADCVPYIFKCGFFEKSNNHIFNIGPTEACTINELAESILTIFFPSGSVSRSLRPKYLPQRPLEVKNAWCSIDKAKKILRYKTTTPLETGLRQMVEWSKTQGPQKFRYLKNLELEPNSTPKAWSKKLI